MKTIKNFLKTIDIFGITLSFKYKQKERYQTVLGGFILILFLILVLIVGIYYFIPFSNRKNYTIVYYTMNLAATERVNLFQAESNIAVGLECEDNKNERLSPYELLEVYANYVLYVKNLNDTYNKITKKLAIHNCNYNDFFNQYDRQIDYLGIKNYKCLKNKDDTIQGIFTDQIFSYYEFTVSAKNDSVLGEIDRFLFENDCKMQFSYTDIIIDLDNYKNPFTQYLNQIFIQLNPVLFIKRNIYFMNQYFTNDDYLMFVFEDSNEPDSKTLYSRYEEYSLYMGFGRNETKPHNYAKYAKIYIRADLKKTIIKRKYQKFMEFYADASSLLIALYYIIYFIFNYIDYFYAYYSISKKIFFFKGVEDDKKFNIFEKRKEIQQILSLINYKGKRNKMNEIEIIPKASGNDIDQIIKKKELSRTIELNSDKKLKGIQIYNSKNTQNENEHFASLKMSIGKEKRFNNRYIPSKVLKIPKYNNKYDLEFKENALNSEDYLQKKKMSEIRKNIDNDDILNIKYKEKAGSDFKNSKKYNNDIISFSSSTSKVIKNKDKSKIKYSFNLLEIIMTQFFKCCMTKKMEIKNNINENAEQILCQKLDINTYIRNMILFDIMNQIILNDDKKDIVNFLCRPLISTAKNDKNEFEEFYYHYKEKDFDKFIKNIKELYAKSQKMNSENKLIFISEEYLRKFF